MKYLPVPNFETVTSALNFNTPDCNVTGGCDLYTTKSTCSDKKLYKTIDDDLNSQYADLLKLGASLSPPQRAAMLDASPSLLSQTSAFGPLSDLTSRRIFAYLIATLNASHPHYDFSNVLRPGDFTRERTLRGIMSNLDSILRNVRPSQPLSDASATSSHPLWGAQCWAMIDKEMRLDECTLFSYQPDIDPFEEDEAAIWSVHYFFFNRALKRVAYLYLRVVPVISSQSPSLSPTLPVTKRRRATTLDSPANASKRAKYWLGERDAELVAYDDEENEDAGFVWNRGEDGDLVPYSDDDYGEEYDYIDGERGFDSDHDLEKSPPRGMSEDIAARMEI